jgi:predicted RNase H-like HicB family nuclease
MLRVEVERENDGRWIAEVAELPGVMTYGSSREEAIAKTESLAARVVADQFQHGKSPYGDTY